MIKTNAVRVLDRLGIRYQLREYEVDPEDLSARTVAAKIGIPPEQLFKTLAVRGDRNGIYLAVIPATEELDFKALAHQTVDRKVDMVPLKEVQAATGYIRGGVTALACKKDYPVYIDELAEICDVISVSAGVRGLQILRSPSTARVLKSCSGGMPIFAATVPADKSPGSTSYSRNSYLIPSLSRTRTAFVLIILGSVMPVSWM